MCWIALKSMLWYGLRCGDEMTVILIRHKYFEEIIQAA